MSPTGIHVNKQVIFVLSLVIGIGVVYFFWDELKHTFVGYTSTDNKKMTSATQSETRKSWDKPLRDGLLEELKKAASNIKVEEKTVQINLQSKTLSIFTRQASPKPARGNVLLLHGQAFTSSNWQEINTISLVAAMGYRVVAVDLPGYGQSKNVSVSSENNAAFMESLLTGLGLTAPVIVSPSMSGSFSLPYLMKGDLQLVATRSKGFVPVAPVHTGKYTTEQYEKLHLPTVAIYGGDDKTPMVKESKNRFKHLPEHEIIIIPDAGHPAYLKQPDKFHAILYNFLNSVYS